MTPFYLSFGSFNLADFFPASFSAMAMELSATQG